MARHKNPFVQKIEFTAIRSLFFIVKILPFSVSSWLGQKLGSFSFWIIRPRRELTIENIREARIRGFLPLGGDDVLLAGKVWEHLCIMGIEFAFYYSGPQQRILRDVTLDGTGNLQRVLEKKKGVVLITTHVGNWELMGMALAKAGFVANSIVQAQSNSLWDRYINDRRRSIGLKVIRKKGFLRPIVEAFKRNEIVSFFIDQDAGKSGIPLKIMGREARIPRGAAEFALKLDKPVVLAYIVREHPRRHRLVISEEIELIRSGDYEIDLRENTAYFIRLVQDVISQYPEQWLWMHKFWKTNLRI